LAIEKPAALAESVQNAGSIFIGTKTPEAIGDYIGGPNHVLPTSGAARFSSGLGVIDFMKRTTLLGCDDGSLSQIGRHAIALADSEGLDAHARSIAVRLS
jgi:histidinol dehydrogenase